MSSVNISSVLKGLIAFGEADRAADEFLSLLKETPTLDPSTDNGYALRWAIEQGYSKLVAHLLQDDRIDVNANHGSPFIVALMQDNAEIFRLVCTCRELVFRKVSFRHVKGALHCAVAFGTAKNLRVFLTQYYWSHDSLGNLLQLAYAHKRKPDVFTVLLTTIGATALKALKFFKHLCAVQDVDRVMAVLPFVEDDLKKINDKGVALACWQSARACPILDKLLFKYTIKDCGKLVETTSGDETVNASGSDGVESKANENTTTTTTTVTLPNGSELHLHIHVHVTTVSPENK